MTALRVGMARASCVIDDYRTPRSRYREIARLVAGPRAATVLVGAAPPRAWRQTQKVIRSAIAGFVAG
ncbi:MAG: hypothetical protein ACR2OB_10500 [Solirubrobacteraceae bacterium]